MAITASLLIALLHATPDVYRSDQRYVERFRIGEQGGFVTLFVARSGDDGSFQVVDAGSSNCARPLECRCAVSGDCIWLLSICYQDYAGLVQGRVAAHVSRFEKSQRLRVREVWRKNQSDAPIHLDDAVAASQGRPILQVLAAETKIPEPIWPLILSKAARWQLQPYNHVFRQWVEADVSPFQPGTSGNRIRVPLAAIAAVSDDQILVGIYMYQRIVWLEMKIMDLADAPEPPPVGPEKFVIGPLKWRSFGLSETAIDTWSTACWIDDSLHMVSDDGKYERFKLKDDKMVRVGRLSELSRPDAICQGRDRLWILSQSKEGTVGATQIGWSEDDKLNRTDRDLGEITMDQAAVRTLAAEREGK